MTLGAGLLAAAGIWFVIDMVTKRTVVDGRTQNRADYRLWYLFLIAAVTVAFAIASSLPPRGAPAKTRRAMLAQATLYLVTSVLWLPLLLSPMLYVGWYVAEPDNSGPVFEERPFNYFRGLLAIALLCAAAAVLGAMFRPTGPARVRRKRPVRRAFSSIRSV